VNRVSHRISAAMTLLIEAARIASDGAWAGDNATLARAATDLTRVAGDAHKVAESLWAPAVLS